MNMRTLLIPLMALLFAAPLAALEFRVVSWVDDINGIYFASGNKTVEIIAGEGLFSQSYTIGDSGQLALFREVKHDDTVVRVPVATLTPPPGVKRAILVLAASNAAQSTYTGLWIDDSIEVRPLETITVRNLSSLTVALRFGTLERTLAANESFIVPVDSSVQRVPFKMAALTPNGWQVVASSSQPVRPGRRTLILLRDGRMQPDAGTQELVDLVTLNDRPPSRPAGTSLASR